MKEFFNKTASRLLLFAGVVVTSLTACNPEPDESDLYTFTGETIESWIQKDSSLTAFNYMLSRIGYDNMMAAYGSYTVFAPQNDGVMAYIDSLWKDPDAMIPHNGMTENSLEGLTDSLITNIVRYHMCNGLRTGLDMSQGADAFSTMLGYDVQFNPASGKIVLNDKATIINSDVEVTNGLIHVLDSVIPRSTRFIGDVLTRNGQFSIFAEALDRTGLADSLMIFRKDKKYTYKKPKDSGGKTMEIYAPEDCKVGFTVFAESDSILALTTSASCPGGIKSFDDLVKYAADVYGEPGSTPSWYDYMAENNLTIAAADDYTNRLNALNLFVAYHIVNASMDAHHLVYEKHVGDNYWNYAQRKPASSDFPFDVDAADPYDYYETMMPFTVMKMWMPMVTGNSNTNPVYINRYVAHNTLTNRIASLGTPDMHPVQRKGVEVNKKSSLNAFNGYIHRINSVLVYDRDVAKGVLNERIRVEYATMLPELITNGIRDVVNTNQTGYDASRYGVPSNYCDNIEVYNEGTIFNTCNHGAWRCYQTDQLQMRGTYDFAIKLPPVPSGVYELRIPSPPLSYGGMMQFYIGSSRHVQDMQALGIPFDMRISGTDPRIGWSSFMEEDDYGVATDAAMRNRGYMRAPFSFCGHGENGWTPGAQNCRAEGGDGTMIIRRIIGTVTLDNKTEHWLRIKTLLESETTLANLDFIELVPMNVINNDTFTEDWY